MYQEFTDLWAGVQTSSQLIVPVQNIFGVCMCVYWYDPEGRLMVCVCLGVGVCGQEAALGLCVMSGSLHRNAEVFEVHGMLMLLVCSYSAQLLVWWDCEKPASSHL